MFDRSQYSSQEVYSVARSAPSERASFIRRTYTHLAGAVLALIALEAVLLNIPGIQSLISMMVGGQYSWLIVLALFMGSTWFGNRWANSETSVATQYLGLGVYVVAYALIFLPILYIAANAYPGVLFQAGVITGLLFAGLTATVFMTRKDFSFLAPIITMSGFIAMGTIVLSIFMGFSLGLLFSALMVLLAAASILYSTSNIMNVYRPTQHVAAALALFGSVAMLFFYILRILMGRR